MLPRHYFWAWKCYPLLTSTAILKCTSDFFSWKQTLWTLVSLLLRDQSNMGPYCLQYRLPKKISPWKSRQKMASGNCQKNEINSIRKNNHKSLPMLYPYRQTHTFNLILGETCEWTDRRQLHQLIYQVISCYSLDILHVRKEAYSICFHNLTVCLLLADCLFYH